MKAGIGGFGVNSYSYVLNHSGFDFVAQLHDAGYSAFELMIFPGHVWPAELSAADRVKFKQALRASGCHIRTLNVPNLDVNIGAADPDVREMSLRLLEGSLGLAADLEAAMILIGPGKPNPLFPIPSERLHGYLFSALDRLLPLARRLGVKIALENLPIAFLPTASSMAAALERYGDPEVGIVYDVANAFFVGEDPASGIRTVGSRLRLIHVSDTTRRVYRHDPIGQGEVPFGSIAAALKDRESVLTMLEIISGTPNRDIQESAEALLALGWPIPAGRQ